jgi:hypothetical protein
MVKPMKKLIFCVFTAAAFLFITCNDPIFYDISKEEKKLEPKIKGSPTNFAVFKGFMYVASGQTIYKYNGTTSDRADRGDWESRNPGGIIFMLAATNNYLFIVCEEAGKNKLKRSNDVISWEEVAGEHNILSIYSAGDQLFLGVGGTEAFSIFTCDNNGENFRKLADTENKLLNGAAWNGSYYLIAKDMIINNGGSIYTSDASLAGLTVIGNNPYVGIINLNNTGNNIVTIDQNGILYNVGVTSLSQITRLYSSIGKTDYPATGALAIWVNESGGENLLLAGRQDKLKASVDTGYTYGYLEIVINESGTSGGFDEPGTRSPSTLSDYASYKSTLRNYPINDIIQSPEINGERIIFASTQKDGVYSCRQRNGSWKWNAEE